LKKMIIVTTVTIVTICCLIIMYIMLHSKPSVALRTHLFMTGHPVVAFTTGIVDDELNNKDEKGILQKENSRCYILTKPAFEKATRKNMKSYKVFKKGSLYFADYYGKEKQ
jgi:hypothetical protein